MYVILVSLTPLFLEDLNFKHHGFTIHWIFQVHKPTNGKGLL
jgi:hypothetical protein